MKKPHIWKQLGLWRCLNGMTKMGIGFTPLQAYHDWLLLQGGKA